MPTRKIAADEEVQALLRTTRKAVSESKETIQGLTEALARSKELLKKQLEELARVKALNADSRSS